VKVDSQTPNSIDDVSSTYVVTYKPAHFTCMGCDVATCDGCAIMCDLTQCVGQFFTEECWCQSESAVRAKKKTWEFDKKDASFALDGSVKRYFCDDQFKGGICDTEGLHCKRRAEACQPWWWCNESPPTTTEEPSVPNFLQELSTEHTNASKQSFLHRSVSSQRSKQRAAATTKGNDMRLLNFDQSRFVCESAALPPKIWDDQSGWLDIGYIIFDRDSCEGSLMEHDCYCWDNFKHLRGEDDMTSVLKCDSKCTWGACECKTCGQSPPPPMTTPDPDKAQAVSFDPSSLDVQQDGTQMLGDG